MKNNLLISILAAGKGTRMESDIPKVLHTINNKSLIENVVLTAQKLNPKKIIIVVGFKKELVINNLKSFDIEYAIQKEQLGTGHAIMQCETLIDIHQKDSDQNNYWTNEETAEEENDEDTRTKLIVSCLGQGYSFGHHIIVFELLGMNIFELISFSFFIAVVDFFFSISLLVKII